MKKEIHYVLTCPIIKVISTGNLITVLVFFPSPILMWTDCMTSNFRTLLILPYSVALNENEKQLTIGYPMSLHQWKFTNITWKFFLFHLIRVICSIFSIFTLYLCFDLTSNKKNNRFLLPLLRTVPFVYIVCPP